MTGSGSRLKVLILSDLHFCKAPTEPKMKEHSWLVHDDPNGLRIWDDMLATLEEESVKPDLILCPGDITTGACGDSLKIAWNKLHELKERFPNASLAVATGNHDVQSRPPQKASDAMQEMEQFCDLTQNLKLLDPPYPIIPSNVDSGYCVKSNRIHYFGTDFSLYDEDPRYRLVVLNSCARHRNDSKEFNRGSIGEASLKWLREEIERSEDNAKINILLCHHHPIKHDEHGLGQYDQMYDGDKLMSLLKDDGHWMVVHGHKHHARLVYDGAGNRKTTVFSAGTFSAHKDTFGPEFHNQFYLLEIEPRPNRAPRGVVKVWNWTPTESWTLGFNTRQRVFTGVGFGYVGELELLAERISSQLTLLQEKSWSDLSGLVEDIKYLVPQDHIYLKDILERSNIEVSLRRDGSVDKLRKVG